MASIAQSLPASNQRLAWLGEWLKDELTPYPGRALLVTRMVLSAALVMIICMTYRIPYSWQAAIYALLVSQETIRATLQSAATIFAVTLVGAGYLILSMRLVLNSPPLHFLWIIATLFIACYAISALTNYLAAVAFVNTVSVGIPLWDRHVSAETNLEDTLWLCLAVLIAVVVTGAVELVFVRRRAGDEIIQPMTERLSAVEDLLGCYAEGRAPDAAAEEKVQRLATLGTSLLRQTLKRSSPPPEYVTVAGSVAVLIGRLVDLAAALPPLRLQFSPGHRTRFRHLASSLATIRNALTNREIPAPIQFDTGVESAAAAPWLGEMEHTVTLMTDVFAGVRSAHDDLPSADDSQRPMLLSRDAFVNPDHLRFALKGCLAASSSYVIYNALAWPGISTAVTTCLLTALSTTGPSHQKQGLRLAGAIVGGFFFGMGAQMFILPYIDSIGGFLLLFSLITTISSWIMTASPRLSYFGVQVALAFYLIHLQEFTIQTSLAIARDRVVGVLVGLFMMWLVFDRLWSSPAAAEMKRTFISNLRLVAQFAREPLSADREVELGRTLALRETINNHLDKTRSLADSVLFEFGPSRQKDLALRDRIRQLQPQLRTLFVMRIASLKYRLLLPGFELPEPVRIRQQAYDEQSARILDEIAGRIEGKPAPTTGSLEESHQLLDRTLEAVPGHAQSFTTLLRRIDDLTTSLASEIAAGTW